MQNNFFYIIVIISISLSLSAQIFVATDGSDSNSGTIDQPFKTIAKAISVVALGDTIYVCDGTYFLTASINIGSSLSGLDSSRYHLFAYKEERPILDFSATTLGTKGISLWGNYWYIRGFDIKYAGDNGLHINGGSHNIIERCNFYENRDSGVQLDNGAAYNRFINCDSYYNADPEDYGDADGFAPKLTVGTGNYFYGCRSWWNCDDGWDGYMRGATDVTTTLEKCWTWKNGYLKDGSDPGSQANGNGFKMGGGDNSNVDLLMHHFNLTNCLAFQNKNKGFDQNNNVGSMTLLNCTGYKNGTANYRIKKELVEGQTLMVKNCVSYDGSVELGTFAIQETNSWLDPFYVNADDFVTLIDSMASAPRKSDGSLPDIEFMNLAIGSDLIDAGVDLGIPYFGSAPDIGAFESNYNSNDIIPEPIPAAFSVSQNYPNPFNPTTTIRYTLPIEEFVNIRIFDVRGTSIANLVNAKKSAGTHDFVFDGSNLASGLYYYRIEAGSFNVIRKMVLLK